MPRVVYKREGGDVGHLEGSRHGAIDAWRFGDERLLPVYGAGAVGTHRLCYTDAYRCAQVGSAADLLQVTHSRTWRGETMPLEGQRIDRYHILRLLGGGMGVVYLAEDPHIGQRMAIKMMRSQPGAYPDATSPLEVTDLCYREIKTIGKLDHPLSFPCLTMVKSVSGTWR